MSEKKIDEMLCKSRSVEGARALNPELQSFSEWLAVNGSQIPIE